jgi:exosome complex component RRP42
MNRDQNAPNGKRHMVKALEEDARYDGRAKNEFRDIKITFDASNTAEGSALITCGNTEIIIGVSLTVGSPFPDRPDEGALMVSCELLPIAHNNIESGPPGIDSIEISRVIDRGIRESKAIDVKKLCITEGEKVWIVNVDVIPINHAGNLIDIGAIGAIAAIQKAIFPLIENGIVNYKEKTNQTLELTHVPIPITVCKIGNQLFVDPTKTEEESIDARLTIAVMENDEICSLQKGGEVPFTVEEVDQALSLAIEKAKDLRKYL